MGLFFNFRAWNLINLDTGELLTGQFEPEETTEQISINYAQHTSLNRQKAILQFVNRASDTLTFNARLFARDIAFNSVEDDLGKLKEWCEIDSLFGRPPILLFWVGDGHLTMEGCVIQSLSGITYGRPTFFGGVKDVSLTINLLKYDPFDLTEKGIFDTRYHRARERDYYEMLTYREYRNPLIGDVIRKRHPTQPNLQVGDIVKLPSQEGIRKERVQTTSLALKNAYSKKVTPQRTLRLDMFDRRNRTKVSHIIL
jgi:hypothetical protein